jgi:hypothetical protein
MKKLRQGWLSCVTLFLCGFGLTANAALINRGSGMVYDDVLDVTWLQDANYAKTSGFDSDGFMSWDLATNWASNLVFGGYSDWRLPTTNPINGVSFNRGFSFNGTTDRGFNIDPSASELGHMFFNNLANVSFWSPTGLAAQPGSESFNSSFVDGESGITYSFENIGITYWTDRLVQVSTDPDPKRYAGYAYNFRTNSGIATGEQVFAVDFAPYSAWALRDGDVASTLSTPPDNSVDVTEPSTIGLLLFSAFGIVAARRQSNAK